MIDIKIFQRGKSSDFILFETGLKSLSEYRIY